MPLDETPLFDPALLRELDWSDPSLPSFSPPVSPSDPGPGLRLRPLCTADLRRGFLAALRGLTRADDVAPDQFVDGFERMKRSGDYYVVVVVEEEEDSDLGQQVVATATLITEHKFIRSCAQRGRVEEVVVVSEDRRGRNWQGKQLGKLLVATLTLLARKLGCYKVTLECSPGNVAFYQKVGYAASDETYMQCRFRD